MFQPRRKFLRAGRRDGTGEVPGDDGIDKTASLPYS